MVDDQFLVVEGLIKSQSTSNFYKIDLKDYKPVVFDKEGKITADNLNAFCLSG